MSSKQLEGKPVDDEDLNGYLMYPKVFLDYMGRHRTYGPVRTLPTRTFFYGMDPGEHCYCKDQFSILLFPKSVHNLAVVCLYICMQLTKTCEVNVIKQCSCCCIHLIDIEFLMKAPCIVTVEWILVRCDIIFICTICSIKTAMSVLSHRNDFVNRYIMRQKLVHLFAYHLAVQTLMKIEMCHHKSSMYSDICSSCSYRLYILS